MQNNMLAPLSQQTFKNRNYPFKNVTACMDALFTMISFCDTTYNVDKPLLYTCDYQYVL